MATYERPLPRGITSFYEFGEPPPPLVDGRAFRSHLYSVAREVQGTVKAKPPLSALLYCNFWEARVEIGDEEIAILLNSCHPYLAFAHPREGIGSPPVFMDHAALAEAFGRLDIYQVLSLADLASPVTPAAIAELSSADLNQIKSWKPQSLGELVFNFWD